MPAETPTPSAPAPAAGPVDQTSYCGRCGNVMRASDANPGAGTHPACTTDMKCTRCGARDWRAALAPAAEARTQEPWRCPKCGGHLESKVNDVGTYCYACDGPDAAYARRAAPPATGDAQPHARPTDAGATVMAGHVEWLIAQLQGWTATHVSVTAVIDWLGMVRDGLSPAPAGQEAPGTNPLFKPCPVHGVRGPTWQGRVVGCTCYDSLESPGSAPPATGDAGELARLRAELDHANAAIRDYGEQIKGNRRREEAAHALAGQPMAWAVMTPKGHESDYMIFPDPQSAEDEAEHFRERDDLDEAPPVLPLFALAAPPAPPPAPDAAAEVGAALKDLADRAANAQRILRERIGVPDSWQMLDTSRAVAALAAAGRDAGAKPTEETNHGA